MRPMLLALLTAWGATLAAQPPQTPQAVAAQLQARLDRLIDFEAEFVQTYEGGVLRARTTESGTVQLKRPDRMRWVYERPERKEFVSDGVRLYAYIPADRQVIVSALPAQADAVPVLLLTGRARLDRDFVAAFTELPVAARGLLGLRLTPRGPETEYAAITLGLDPRSLQVRYLDALDRQGGRSAFTFANVKENRGLSDRLFEFRVPRGVDVITHAVQPE